MTKGAQDKFHGIKKVQRVLLASLILLVEILYVATLVVEGGESLGGLLLWFLNEPLVFLLIGLLLVFVLPRKLRDAALCCLLLFMNGFFLFWLCIFSLVWYTGLPPWMIGKSPWM